MLAIFIGAALDVGAGPATDPGNFSITWMLLQALAAFCFTWAGLVWFAGRENEPRR